MGTQLGAAGQGGNLDARIVVIKLAVDLKALGCKQITNRITQSGLAAVADVERACGVGGYEFHQKALAVFFLVAKACFGRQNFANGLLFGGGLEANVDKAGAGDLNVLNPLLKHRRGQQGFAQLFAELAGVALQRLGQLHGCRNRKVTMRGDLGRFKGGFGASAW